MWFCSLFFFFTENKKIESKDSSTKGLLGGFGIPLLQIANIVQSVVDATRKQRVPPDKTDRVAIVTKPTGDVIEKYPTPNFPKFETGKYSTCTVDNRIFTSKFKIFRWIRSNVAWWRWF